MIDNDPLRKQLVFYFDYFYIDTHSETKFSFPSKLRVFYRIKKAAKLIEVNTAAASTDFRHFLLRFFSLRIDIGNSV